MYIKQLRLQNYRGFEDATINFPDTNIAVFFGINGGGKTSVLDALAALLSQWLSNRLRVYMADATYTYNFTKFINTASIKEQKEEAVIHIEVITQTSDCSWRINLYRPNIILLTEIQKKNNSTYTFPIMDQSVYVMVYYSKKHLGETSTNIQNGDSFYDTNQLTYKDAFTPQANDMANFKNWFVDEVTIENEEKIKQEDLTITSPTLNVIREAIKIFTKRLYNTNFSDIYVKHNHKKTDFAYENKLIGDLRIKKGDEDLSFDQLSKGEQTVLHYCCDIARRLIIANPKLENPLWGKGIVLIDEIDAHLHPLWQRSIIPALRNTFPNVQFIVATHSEQVLSEVPNGSVFELDNFIVKQQNTYGRSNDWILQTVMNDIERPQEVLELLENYFDLIRANQLDEAQLLRTKLEELIGFDEPEFVKADILITRKKRELSR